MLWYGVANKLPLKRLIIIAAGLTLLRVRHLYLLITQHEVVLYYQHHWKVLCWYVHISPFFGKCYFKISEIALHSVWGLY